MAFDIKTLATINLAIQILLIIGLSFAILKTKKGELQMHCNIVRILVIIQLAAIFIVMLPSVLGFVLNQNPGSLFNLEILFHHTVGSLLVILWIYINLVYAGIIRWPDSFKSIMRFAFVLWMLAFFIGLHIYFRIY